MVEKVFTENVFTGFDSHDQVKPKTQIHDIDLVKRDLLNQFMTRKGERVMRPTYGSIIWDLLFEPFTELIRDAIISDAERIVTSDARLELIDLNVVEFEHGIRIDIALLFQPFNVSSSFSVDFDRRNSIKAISEFE